MFLKLREKLAARLYGPFTVLANVGAVAYTPELPPSSKVLCLVFYLSR